MAKYVNSAFSWLYLEDRAQEIEPLLQYIQEHHESSHSHAITILGRGPEFKRLVSSGLYWLVEVNEQEEILNEIEFNNLTKELLECEDRRDKLYELAVHNYKYALFWTGALR